MERLLVIVVLILTSLYTIISVLSGKQITIKTKNHHEDIRLSIFYFGAVIGVLIFLAAGEISLGECYKIIIGNNHLSPIGILILFLSMASISIFLDYCGFFQYCANVSVRYAGTSQLRLFVILYLTVSILTIFTSNDIIILTFTPFIYYFTANRKINAVPYLIAEFFAANTWSMVLPIGNPTNIVITEAFDINFAGYISKMLLPTVAAGLINFIAVFLIFHRQLCTPLTQCSGDIPTLKDKHGTIVGISILAVCIVTLSIASVVKIKTYIVAAFFALLLLLFIILRMSYNYVKAKKQNRTFKNPILVHTFKKMPWNVIPFIISLSIIVAVANKNEICRHIGSMLLKIIGTNHDGCIAVFGCVSTLTANIINNIPMSVLFVDIIDSIPAYFTENAALATVIGSNLGANVTPLGALAGIMWITILKNHGFKFSFLDFIRYGCLVTTLSLAGALICLSLVCR